MFLDFSNIQPKWHEVLAPVLASPAMKYLQKCLQSAYSSSIIYPDQEDILRAFELTDYDKVQVVILGQDPYHNVGQANGLAFAVEDDCFPKPPSLRRILDEVERDLGVVLDRNTSSLEGWASQGVLLLNSTLTVQDGCANSHKNIGWEYFTDTVIQLLNDRQRPIVFLLWGKVAQSKQILINNPIHHILIAPHPSPLAKGFENCKHFSQANALLAKPINWAQIT